MIVPDRTVQTLNALQSAALRCALYFDIFDYPLTWSELFTNCAVATSEAEFNKAIADLVGQGLLKESGGFVMLPWAAVSCTVKRQKGNAMAAAMLPVAQRFSERIAKFPFVRGVCISGGLSKNYYDHKSDIDYFVITKPGRLWICRSLLILRYKLLPRNKKKFWCTNYFVSEDHLSLSDRNQFTATELAFLVPTVNHAAYEAMHQSNQWATAAFPNRKRHSPERTAAPDRSPVRRTAEWMIDRCFANKLDDLLLRITLRRWQRKYPDMPAADFELQFRSRKGVCKRHTHGFQDRVLNAWREKQQRFTQEFQVELA